MPKIMKQAAAQKTPQATAHSAGSEACAGPGGIAIAPPSYGVDVVDSQGEAGFDYLPGPVSNQPVVQRKVEWQETSQNNINLADTIIAGADFGFTAILVNGTESTLQAPQALAEPEYKVDRVDGGGVELSVAKEAQNRLTTRMDLPTAPPWVRDVDKARVGGRLIGDARALGVEHEVLNYALGNGQTRLRVRGTPGDGTLARLIKDHEQYHVNDDKAAKEAIVDPWDAAIAAKKRNGVVTAGADPISALQQFYTDIGGSGAQIGQAYMAECARRGTAYHRTALGAIWCTPLSRQKKWAF